LATNTTCLDLRLDVFPQQRLVDHAEAAGVDQLEASVAALHGHCDAVTGDAGRRLDDRNAAAGEPVEQARLADVGPADDGDAR
jgi:hypothetical protein